MSFDPAENLRAQMGVRFDGAGPGVKTPTIHREPRVYLIGRPLIDEFGLDAFLADQNVATWETDTDQAGEQLAEIAGRLCYMSYSRPRPGGNAEYLRHIIEVGHGCYDEDTDVLTAEGWKRWADVTELDRLATRTAEGTLEYHRPTRLFNYEHQGRMYRVESRGVDLLVTPNHNMLVCPTTTKEGRKRNDYTLIKASDLGTRAHAYVKDVDWRGGDDEGWITPDIAALLGFAIGDGTMRKSSAGRGAGISFHLRRERKITWLTSLLSRLGWQWEAHGDRYEVHLPNDANLGTLFSLIYGADDEKQIPPGVVDEAGPGNLWPKSLLLSLYEGLMQSDGHVGETGDSFDTTSRRLVDQFQHLCLLVGMAANVCYEYGPERRQSSYGEKPLIRLSVIRRELRPEVNKYRSSAGRSYWVEDFQGTVYCAEVPNHTLYVRRNGKAVWCGNSVLEHACFNFIITQVSRSFTHELVRHRLASYSQLSQRYVDESDCAFVMPDEIAADAELADSFRHYVREARDTYQYWSDVLSETVKKKYPSLSATDQRKIARQTARACLPNCTETRIFVSMNARALRHFFVMRGSLAADAEMRRVALMVFSILKVEAPAIFEDFEVKTDPEGRQYLHTQFAKV